MAVTEKEKTAYHEAGHAVIGILLNLDIRDVTIVPTREYAGITHAKIWSFEEFSLKQIVTAFAGACAQGRRVRHYLWAFLDGGREDLEYVGKCGERLRCSPRIIPDLEMGTRKFVNRAWPLIDAFAKRLLISQTVSSDEARSMVEKAEGAFAMADDLDKWIREQEKRLPLPSGLAGLLGDRYAAISESDIQEIRRKIEARESFEL